MMGQFNNRLTYHTCNNRKKSTAGFSSYELSTIIGFTFCISINFLGCSCSLLNLVTFRRGINF
jgi:hypothetical protein